jgi:hypothetical protein
LSREEIFREKEKRERYAVREGKKEHEKEREKVKRKNKEIGKGKKMMWSQTFVREEMGKRVGEKKERR